MNKALTTTKYNWKLAAFSGLLVALVGTYLLVFSKAATQTTYLVTATGNDANPCTVNLPCQTFDRAYSVAAPGDVVEVAAGAYPAQTINADPSKTSEVDVVIRPINGAAVTVESMTIHASHLEVSSMRTKAWHVKENASDVTMRNIDVNLDESAVPKNRWFVTSASNIRVIGGSVGPMYAKLNETGTGAVQIKPANGGINPNNITVEGHKFHDFTRDLGGDIHIGCFHIFGGDSITLRGNTFERCSVYDVNFAGDTTSGQNFNAPRNVLVENNLFLPQTSDGGQSMRIRGGSSLVYKNYTIRNNTWMGGNSFSPGYGADLSKNENMIITNNYAKSFTALACNDKTVQWNKNFYTNADAGTPICATQTNHIPDAAGVPQPGSPLINGGTSTNFAPSDMLGKVRPSGTAPDVGAYEVESDDNVYVATTGLDTNDCKKNSPCLTFDRAYKAVKPGKNVIVQAGTYARQEIGYDAAKTAEKVTFLPESGEVHIEGGLKVKDASNIELRDMKVRGWYVGDASSSLTHIPSNVTLRNIKSYSAGNFITSADRVSLINSEIGPVDPLDGLQVKKNANVPQQVTNLLIDGLFMHDLTRDKSPTSHTDCVQILSGVNVTIRNSRFTNCATQGITINSWNGGIIDGLVIENNWFGRAQLGTNMLIIGSDTTTVPTNNVLIRNNSFMQGWRFEKSVSNARVINNIFPASSHSCDNYLANFAVEFSHNITDNPCNRANVVGHIIDKDLRTNYFNSSSDNSALLDLHIKATSPAINKGKPGSYPATDFDGNLRPQGSGPDIGADEFLGSTPNPAPNPGPSNPTPAPTEVTDLNKDGKVNAVDLSFLLARFNRKDTQALSADINGDGTVNVIDLSMLLKKFGAQ